MSLEARIEQLEAALGRRRALVWLEAGADEAATLAAHVRAHPEDADAELVAIGWARPGETFDPARDA